MSCAEHLSSPSSDQLTRVVDVAARDGVGQPQVDAVSAYCVRNPDAILGAAVPAALDEYTRFQQLAPGLTRERYSVSVEEDSYQQTLTFELGPVLPGDDPALTQYSWVTAGGTGAFPCQDVSDLTTGRYVTETTGYAFGTLTVTNDTPDFPALEHLYQFTRPGSAIGYGFGSGAVCRTTDGGGDFLSPSWQGATWGPTPVVVAVQGYRTPDHPAGDPELLRLPLVAFLTDLEIPLRAWSDS